MWCSLLGLFLDILGAFLLIKGQIKSTAALVKYWGTGEQSENYRQRIAPLAFWRRWPIQLAVRFGPKAEDMGSEPVLDSFPIKAWGIALLILGFVFQAFGSVFPSC